MERIAVIAKLKPGSAARAEELIEQGPPFDPRETGFERHAVFLTGDQAVFIFEGGKLERLLRSVVRAPDSAAAFRTWGPILDGIPKVAHQVYFWQAGDEWPPSREA